MRATLAVVLLLASCSGLRDLDAETPNFCADEGSISAPDPTQTDQCCSDDADCEAVFRAVGLDALAACGQSGLCYLDCRPGDNCACSSDAACDASFGLGCTVTDRDADMACENQGQNGTGRCTICRECDGEHPCERGTCRAPGYCAE